MGGALIGAIRDKLTASQPRSTISPESLAAVAKMLPGRGLRCSLVVEFACVSPDGDGGLAGAGDRCLRHKSWQWRQAEGLYVP
jgi:hypothetical protein